MRLLAIDCSANFCAACVFDSGTDVERGRHVLDLGKGHAEQLIVVVDEAMKQAGIGYGELDAIAVSIGPGSFTGIRVAVAAARGYALALSIPAIGVNTLEALAAATRYELGARPVLAALAAGPDGAQAAIYDAEGAELHPPALMTLTEAADLARRFGAVLAGTASTGIAALTRTSVTPGQARATADIVFYARLAALRGTGAGRPTPLYLREPDAKPQAGFMVPRISDGGDDAAFSEPKAAGETPGTR